MSSQIIISPRTKVGELLDAYPELEPVLISMSPAFEKLKNPILRKTVARVATLQQVAIVGKIKVDDIVNRLRKEIGHTEGSGDTMDIEYLSVAPPGWFDETKITHRFDASPLINSGGSPMNEILKQARLLKSAEIFELRTPFIPAPVIDMLPEKGFKVYCVQAGEYVNSFISR